MSPSNASFPWRRKNPRPGKGDTRSATAGALFETLEHSFTGPAPVRQWPPRTVPAQQVGSGPLAADAAFAEPARTADTSVASGPHTSVRDGRRVDRVKAHSANTGSAIGAPEDEAVLHALGECMERDAFSLFLLWRVHDRVVAPRRLASALLSAGLADLPARPGWEISGDVELSDHRAAAGGRARRADPPVARPAARHHHGAPALPGARSGSTSS